MSKWVIVTKKRVGCLLDDFTDCSDGAIKQVFKFSKKSALWWTSKECAEAYIKYILDVSKSRYTLEIEEFAKTLSVCELITY